MKASEFEIRDVEFEMLWEFYNEISNELLIENIDDANKYVVGGFLHSSVPDPVVGQDYYFMTVHWIPQSISDDNLKIIKLQYSPQAYKLDKVESNAIIMEETTNKKFRLPVLVTNYSGMRAFTVLLETEKEMNSLTQSLTKIKFSKGAGWDLRIGTWVPHAGSYQ